MNYHLGGNGFNGHFYDKPPHFVFSALLKHSMAETLMKARQISLFKYACSLNDNKLAELENRWKSICIAIRNDYEVPDASDWLDYLGFLERFDKDVLSPKYVCPDDLHEEHQRYYGRIQRIEAARKVEEKKKELEKYEPVYQDRKSHFFHLKIKDKDIEIVPFTSVKQFIVEGDMLKHCIFSSSYFKRDGSLLLSARIDGEVTETVEVCLDEFRVKQARGFQNKPTKHHDRIIEVVDSNMSKIAKCVMNKRREYEATG